MGLTMTKRKTTADVKAKRKRTAHVVADQLLDRLEQQKRHNTRAFVESLGKELRRKDLDDAAKARVRAMGLGALIDEEDGE